MSPLLLYLGKLLAYSGIFAAYYWLFMRKASFIRWNRWYIMVVMVLSVLLPLVELTIVRYYEAAPVTIEVLDGAVFGAANDTAAPVAFLPYLLAALYALVAVALVVGGVASLLRIYRLKRTNTYRQVEAAKLYCCLQKIAPFSFFKSIFIPDTISSTSTEGQQILRHELEHVRARHSLDKVLAQVLCTIFWFNPFFWLLRREQSMVHEFLADQACVKDGGKYELSRLILCTLYPEQHTYFGSQFFQSPIKRRLAMIANTKTKYGSLRKLLVVPLALACLCVLALKVEAKPIPQPQPEPTPTPVVADEPTPDPTPERVVVDEPTPEPIPEPQPPKSTSDQKGEEVVVIAYGVVDVQPEFPGGKEALVSWLGAELKYPQEAQDKNIQGNVIVRFVIEKDGTVSDIHVVKSADPILDAEAIRVVGTSPAWTPGKLKGENIRSYFTLPVVFKLDKKNEPDQKSVEISVASVVDVQPEFPGGREELSRWLAMNLRYPKEAQDKNVQGRVIVRFTIEKDGTVSDVNVVRSADPLLDAEAVRVMKTSPTWTPAKLNGKDVRSDFTLPVVFMLDTKDKSKSIE